jgi:hypothetical protein
MACFFLDFHLSRAVIIALLMRYKNQNAYLFYERWYSQDLQLLVMSRYADPRFGETVYRVANLQREEPTPSLFAVPPGYRIAEKLQETAPDK